MKNIELIANILPPETIHTGWFKVLLTFVAINTIFFAILALFKFWPIKEE